MARRMTALLVTLVMALQASGCGLLLYPERKGQKTGSIDPGVAILDAAGLLVFVVPGLIAFGVDFVTGCIYLPGGRRASTAAAPLQTAYLDPRHMDLEGIETAVQKATGSPVNLADPGVRTVEVADVATLEAQVNAAL